MTANARSDLRGAGDIGALLVLGICQSLRQALGDKDMDYVIAGIAAIGLFVYLVRALLRPERF